MAKFADRFFEQKRSNEFQFADRRAEEAEFREALEEKSAVLDEVLDLYRGTIDAVEQEKGVEGILSEWLNPERQIHDPYEFKQNVLLALKDELRDLEGYQQLLTRLKPKQETEGLLVKLNGGHRQKMDTQAYVEPLESAHQADLYKLLELNGRCSGIDTEMLYLAPCSELKRFTNALQLDEDHFRSIGYKSNVHTRTLKQVKINGMTPYDCEQLFDRFSGITFDDKYLNLAIEQAENHQSRLHKSRRDSFER